MLRLRVERKVGHLDGLLVVGDHRLGEGDVGRRDPCIIGADRRRVAPASVALSVVLLRARRPVMAGRGDGSGGQGGGASDLARVISPSQVV